MTVRRILVITLLCAGIVGAARYMQAQVAQAVQEPPYPAVSEENTFAAQPIGVLTLRPLASARLVLPDSVHSYTVQLLPAGVAVWADHAFLGYVTPDMFVSPATAATKSPDDKPIISFHSLTVVFATADQDPGGLYVAIGIVFQHTES